MKTTRLHKFMMTMLSLLMLTPANAYDFMVNGLCYTINSDGTSVRISFQNNTGSSYTSLTGDVVIPESVNHNGKTYPVTAIGANAFRQCYELTSITIPNSITIIGYNAFYYCLALSSVNIPNSVTGIGDNAFFSCKLTSVTIPNTVTTIGTGVFNCCSELTSITVLSSNTYYDSRNGCNAIIETNSNKLIAGCKNTIIPNSITSIDNYAFYGCDKLTSVTIPNSVTSIGKGAFSYCSGLETIVVASGNTTYDSRNNCNAIIETTSNTLMFGCKNTFIPNTVSSLSELSFYGCKELTSITIPNSVTSIGRRAFYECTELTSVSIANSVKDLGTGTFSWCSKLSSINLPNSITTIGDYLFYYCYKLNDITIPNSVTKISEYAFQGCSGLTSVTIGNSVTTIGNHAFSGCRGLTSINIPNSVKTIKWGAFSSCSNLTSVVLGENIESIDEKAFSGNYNINSITCKGLTPASLEADDIFASNVYTNATVHVPNGCVRLYYFAPVWTLFEDIVKEGSMDTVHGDVTGDGNVDISDVNAVINLMLGKE